MSLVQNAGLLDLKTFSAKCKCLERSDAKKIVFIRVGVNAYPFLFNTFLTILVVILFISERYCIFIDVKFPSYAFCKGFSVLMIFLLSVFDDVFVVTRDLPFLFFFCFIRIFCYMPPNCVFMSTACNACLFS